MFFEKPGDILKAQEHGHTPLVEGRPIEEVYLSYIDSIFNTIAGERRITRIPVSEELPVFAARPLFFPGGAAAPRGGESKVREFLVNVLEMIQDPHGMYIDHPHIKLHKLSLTWGRT